MPEEEKPVSPDDYFREIDKVNSLMAAIAATNESIDKVTDTIVLSKGEIVDLENLSVMSLPSTKEFYRNL